MLSKPSGAQSERKVLSHASFGLCLSVEAGLRSNVALGTSCCCLGTAVEKDVLLGVVQHVVVSSSKSFLPVTAEAQTLLNHSSCGT